jgi:hypothetical protein
MCWNIEQLTAGCGQAIVLKAPPHNAIASLIFGRRILCFVVDEALAAVPLLRASHPQGARQ